MNSAAARTIRMFADQPTQLELPLGFLLDPAPVKTVATPVPSNRGESPNPAPATGAAKRKSAPIQRVTPGGCTVLRALDHAPKKVSIGKPAKLEQTDRHESASARSLGEPHVVEFTMSVKLVNPLNGSQGRSWGGQIGRSVRRKKERVRARHETELAFQSKDGIRRHPSWVTSGHDVVVTLTRIAPGKFDDDNLAAAFKGVRDGVADALGFKDDSAVALEWRYAQEPGRRLNRKKGVLAQHEVKVRIQVRT